MVTSHFAVQFVPIIRSDRGKRWVRIDVRIQ
jgi:hypothetical protein